MNLISSNLEIRSAYVAVISYMAETVEFKTTVEVEGRHITWKLSGMSTDLLDELMGYYRADTPDSVSLGASSHHDIGVIHIKQMNGADIEALYWIWLGVIRCVPFNPQGMAMFDRYRGHWQANDKAHREEHFNVVYRCGLYINQVLQLGFSDHMIALVAYFHDLFAWSRENHHDLSGTFVEGTEDPLFSGLSQSERMLVADACREHRASFSGDFSHSFSEMMNAADRGFPNTAVDLLHRAVDYRTGRYSSRETQAEIMRNSVMHVKEKFGTGGYARYPHYYTAVFGKALDDLRKDVDALEV